MPRIMTSPRGDGVVDGFIVGDGLSKPSVIHPSSTGSQRNVLTSSLRSVLRQRQAERSACLSLPFTIAFFVFFTLSVGYHDESHRIHQVESSLRNFLQTDLKYIVLPEDIWEWTFQSFLPEIFSQKDYLDKPLPPTSWSTILNKNVVRGGVLMEQFRKPGSGPPGPADGSCLNGTDLMSFPGEGFLPLTGTPMGSSSRRLRSGGGAGGGNYGTIRLPNLVAKAEDTYPVLLFEHEPFAVLRSRLKCLEDSRWIDQDTTQITMKMVLLNEEMGCLVHAVIRFALPETGGIFSTLGFQSSLLETYGRHWAGIFLDIGFIALLVWISVKEIKEVSIACYHGKEAILNYFKDVWNVLDWASIILGWTIVVLFVGERNASEALRDKIQALALTNPPDANYWGDMYQVHQDAANIADITMWFRIVLGDYTLLVMMRFFKAFRGQPRLAMVSSTISSAAEDLVHFGIVFFAVFFCFACSGMILFGRRVPGFSSFANSFGTCFAIACGEFDWQELSAEHVMTSMIWFWSFMILVFLVMLNMVLAIVMDVYTKVRANAVYGDPIWKNAFDLVSRIGTKVIIMLKRRTSSATIRKMAETNNLPEVLVSDAQVLSKIRKMGNRVNVAKLRKEFPQLTPEQAEELLSNAEAWEVQHDKKGMSLSDAMMLIDRINVKVDELMLRSDQSRKNKKGIGAVHARRMVKRKIRRALCSAVFSGELHRIAQSLDNDEFRAQLLKEELARKIKRADELLYGDQDNEDLRSNASGEIPFRKSPSSIDTDLDKHDLPHSRRQSLRASPSKDFKNQNPSGLKESTGSKIQGMVEETESHAHESSQARSETFSISCSVLCEVQTLRADIRRLETSCLRALMQLQTPESATLDKLKNYVNGSMSKVQVQPPNSVGARNFSAPKPQPAPKPQHLKWSGVVDTTDSHHQPPSSATQANIQSTRPHSTAQTNVQASPQPRAAPPYASRGARHRSASPTRLNVVPARAGEEFVEMEAHLVEAHPQWIVQHAQPEMFLPENVLNAVVPIPVAELPTHMVPVRNQQHVAPQMSEHVHHHYFNVAQEAEMQPVYGEAHQVPMQRIRPPIQGYEHILT